MKTGNSWANNTEVLESFCIYLPNYENKVKKKRQPIQRIQKVSNCPKQRAVTSNERKITGTGANSLDTGTQLYGKRPIY